MTSRFPPLPLSILIAFLLFIGAITVGVALYLLTQQPYTIYDDETPITVNGRYDTVADILEAGAISLRPEDIVVPDRHETTAPESTIQIRRAQPVTVVLDNESQTYWTQQSTLAAFLAETRITLQPNQRLLADQQPVTLESFASYPLPAEIDISLLTYMVTIQDGDQQQVLQTAAQTIGQALQEMGIDLDPADSVNPAPSARLESGTIIQITRAIPLTIQVDGQTIHTRSLQTKPLELLTEAGIELGKADYTSPEPETTLRAGDIVQVIRGSDDFRIEDEEIPFQTLYQPSEELDLDTKAVLSAGAPGIKRRRIRLLFEDGIQVGEELDEEWIEQEPLNQIIGYGTRITVGTIDTPEGPREYWRVVRMRATAYSAASSGKPPDHPAYGITASGVPAGTGVVAADLNVIPFRSEVYVPDYGIGFVGDTGGGVKGRWIDLGFDEDELVAWNGYADVYYLTPIPEKINYLLPEVLP
jgi:uncharacterized protein YabE (DUF348 family)